MQSTTWSYRVPAGIHAASAARGWLTEALKPAVRPGLLDDARLLVSELVTNSVIHSGVEEGDQLTLEVGINDTLHVSVSDAGAGFMRSATESDDLGGWGLILVDRLADRWGVVRDEATHVWFEIDCGEDEAGRSGSESRQRLL